MLTGAARAAARTGLSLRQALRTRSFYLMTIGLTAASITYQGILTQIVPHLENEGFSAATAAAALTLVAAMGIGSKLGFGRLSESISARRAAVLSIAFQAIGVGLMIAPGGDLVLWSGVFVFGLGFGGLGAMIVLSISEAFGLYAFGAIMGMVNLAMITSMTAGPLLTGVLFDATGSYHLPFAIIIGVFVLGMVALLASKQPGRMPVHYLGDPKPPPQTESAKAGAR